MTEKFKDYEKTIRKKHKIGWTPAFRDKMAINIEKKHFIPLTLNTLEQLGWDLVFQDEEEGIVEAKIQGQLNQWTEKITVLYDYRRIEVTSKSLGNEMWDMGRNSKRVKLFMYAFQEIFNELAKEGLASITTAFEQKRNWDDYVVPDTLPPPLSRKKPEASILLAGSFISALLLGYFLGLFAYKASYILVLYEIFTGFMLSFIFTYLMRISNYYGQKINQILIGCILLIYSLFYYVHYHLIISNDMFLSVNFIEYIYLRFTVGLFKGDGILIFLICFALQSGFTWMLASIRIVSKISEYLLQRVPAEVIDFAYYHLIKDKTEEQVRMELAKKGWTEEEQQNEVFEGLYALHEISETNRI